MKFYSIAKWFLRRSVVIGDVEPCQTRNANLDVFRCLLMFLIVVRHAFHCGLYRHETAWWVLLFGPLITWHTDGFLSLSGWFGIRFSWRKVIRLWGVIAFYGVIGGFLLYVQNGFQVTIPVVKSVVCLTGGWVSTYLMLMFVSPFLNAAVEHLVEKSLSIAWKAWGVFAFAEICAWMPSHAATAIAPNGWGVSCLSMFVFLYVTVRLVRLSGVIGITWFGFCCVTCIFFGGMLFMGMLAGVYRFVAHLPFDPRVFGFAFYYDAPFVWVFAIALLLLFQSKLKFPSWVCRGAVLLAPSMLGVYLCHCVMPNGPFMYLVPMSCLRKLGFHPIGQILVGGGGLLPALCRS